MAESNKKCDQCNRSELFFDGCSMLECPKRKKITAGYQDLSAPFCHNGGGYIKAPTNKEGAD